MKIRNALPTLASLAILSASLLTTAVEAKDLRYAIGHPPGSYLLQAGEIYAKTVDELTDGDIKVKLYPMSLLSMDETSDGLRDGIADVGSVMTTYFPSLYPHYNFLMEASLSLLPIDGGVGSMDGVAYAAAVTEMVMLNCPECLKEASNQGQVFTGAGGTTSYALNCTKPVSNMEQMKGKRLRVGGAQWSRWTDYVGGSSVSMSGNEMLEALNQGVLDCIILSLPDVYGFGMGESVTDITPGIPGGVYVSNLAQFNKRTWDKLNNNEREAVMRASSKAAANLSFNYYSVVNDLINKAKDSGVNIHKVDSSLLEKTKEFSEQDLDVMVEYYGNRYKNIDGADILKKFQPILNKWLELTKEIESEEKLADLYWSEIYTKVNLSEYSQ